MSFPILLRLYPAVGGGVKSFGNYYKRRINRIFPSVFAAIVFVHIIDQRPYFHWTEFLAIGSFVMWIMIYYVLLYFVRKYAVDKIKLILYCLAFATLLVYILWFPYKYETSSNGLYGVTTNFRWIPYFGAMLLGAYIGMKRKELNYRPWLDFFKLMVCMAIFYGIQFGAKIYRPIAPLQIVTLLPLMGMVVYIYKCCHAEWLAKLYNTKWGNILILFVGGLCLESYLIQFILFTDKMNGIWPLNLLIMVLLILACSYLVRCAARLFAQTFRTEDYEWKKVFSMY